MCLCAQSLQLYPTLCDPMDYSPPSSSVHGILQVRILEWVAMPFSKGSSQPRDRIQVSCVFCIAGSFFEERQKVIQTDLGETVAEMMTVLLQDEQWQGQERKLMCHQEHCTILISSYDLVYGFQFDAAVLLQVQPSSSRPPGGSVLGSVNCYIFKDFSVWLFNTATIQTLIIYNLI